MPTLSREEWSRLAEAHRQRVDAALADVIYRRDRAIKHPIDDFLFHYYNLRPSALRQWHPGVGVVLDEAQSWSDRPFYRVEDRRAQVDTAKFVAKRAATLATAARLLHASSAATPRFRCFGMHEWAMVYRLDPRQLRHPYLKLRYEPREIERIVTEVGCNCTHFDAFRFFTASAKPLNAVQLTREGQAEHDQPGCLHVNMDLYKWAGKLLPAVSSDLVFDCFELARDIRVVDMRASAYDLSEWGHSPIAVEEAAGRAQYVALQRGFAQRAAPLRRRLLETIAEITPR